MKMKICGTQLKQCQQENLQCQKRQKREKVSYIRKEKKSQTNNVSSHLKNLEKQKQKINPKEAE